ncbi:MAG TPA: methyltransferase domain-containing protein, partial [Burkholderiales bacterium]|nr:methyltransferase domain-containing protein [Burkholderiales bacterium]
MTWDPAQYRKFSGHRTRPAADLIDRVPLDAPKIIADLGCGEGAVTQLLHRRWPQADLTGVDSSAEMLGVAVRELPDAHWEKADIATWMPPAPVDLLFSNAALQWLTGHATLFPRLIDQVKPGGVLAVQMPRNFTARSHTLVTEVARSGPWREKLVPLLRVEPVAAPEFYYDLLAPRVAELDIWETEYLQVLAGDNPIAEWTKGTWRRPLLAALDDAERQLFEAEYRQRIAESYPPRRDGKTL